MINIYLAELIKRIKQIKVNIKDTHLMTHLVVITKLLNFINSFVYLPSAEWFPWLHTARAIQWILVHVIHRKHLAV